jgi:hypothetical protein
VLAELTVGFLTAVSGVHRYDVRARTWIDHGPVAPGIQPIGPQSLPQGPLLTSSDLALARDGSFAVLTGYNRIERIDFDRNDPRRWQIVSLPFSAAPSTSFGHTTSDGMRVLLLAPGNPLSDSQATLIHLGNGATLAATTLTGIPWISRFAER